MYLLSECLNLTLPNYTHMVKRKFQVFKFVQRWCCKRRQFGGRAWEWILESSGLRSDSLHSTLAQLLILYKLAMSGSHWPTAQGKQVRGSQLITFLEFHQEHWGLTVRLRTIVDTKINQHFPGSQRTCPQFHVSSRDFTRDNSSRQNLVHVIKEVQAKHIHSTQEGERNFTRGDRR